MGIIGTVFSNWLAIYRRELQGYFASPLAYGIAGVFWLLAGFFFVAILLGPEGIIVQGNLRAAQAQQLGITVPPFDMAEQFIQLYLGTLGSLSLFILPILSMGLYAEERKRGTLELLATSPITNWVVALGKWAGALTLYISLVLPLLLLEIIAFSKANPPVAWGVPVAAHVGLILLAAAVLSLGMFVSSLTDSTVMAAILTFSLVLLLWVMDLIAASVGGAIGDGLTQFSLLNHFNGWVSGAIETRSLFLFGTYTFLGIFLPAQAIETLRFQRT